MSDPRDVIYRCGCTAYAVPVRWKCRGIHPLCIPESGMRNEKCQREITGTQKFDVSDYSFHYLISGIKENQPPRVVYPTLAMARLSLRA